MSAASDQMISPAVYFSSAGSQWHKLRWEVTQGMTNLDQDDGSTACVRRSCSFFFSTLPLLSADIFFSGGTHFGCHTGEYQF